MQDKLKALATLQKVDLEVAAAKKAAEVYPRQMAELEKTLASAKSAVEAERARLADLEREKLSLEQNITDEKDKVKKWEARLAEQRSTREYSALAREIDIAKKANLTMAEQVVELAKQVAGQREAMKGKEQELLARQDQIGGQISELQGQDRRVPGPAEELRRQARRGRGEGRPLAAQPLRGGEEEEAPGARRGALPGDLPGLQHERAPAAVQHAPHHRRHRRVPVVPPDHLRWRSDRA